jgi:uncharacterized protein (DUF1015 family)
MAKLQPFRPHRYTEAAGSLQNLVTQPYDKITPSLQSRYLSLSPYNLVRVILGERFAGDDKANNVYTRAARYLNDWIAGGILTQDSEPGFYPYFQDFSIPDTGEQVTRKGFIGLCQLEDYSAGVVHRHEQTLSGPKKDRLELLRHTRAHFGQLFVLYSDPERGIDALLDEAAAGAPLGVVRDEYGAVHRLWKIASPARIERIADLMAAQKLVIADGHHRYETALAFRQENPDLLGAHWVMMTFVNTHSAGLQILATHRLLHGLEKLDVGALVDKARGLFRVETLDSPEALKQRLATSQPDRIRIALAVERSEKLYLFEADRAPGQLDVRILHEVLLGQLLGISEEAVREEKYLRYIRGFDAALEEVRAGRAQIAFLLEPTTVEQVAEVSLSGGVMPQKSTDFYPKLLSGLTIYKL